MASILVTMLVIIVSSHFNPISSVHIEFSSISAAPAILPGADVPSPNFPALSPDILPILPTPKAGAMSPSPSDQPTTIPSSPSPPNPDFFLPPGPEPDMAFPPSGFLPAASRASSASADPQFVPCVNLTLFQIGVLVFCFKQLFAM